MASFSSSNSISEIIRQAEKQIASSNLDRARELLSQARFTYPGNEYITAILERIDLLEHQPVSASASQKAVSVSLPESAQAPPLDTTAMQVKRLTKVACTLNARGSVGPAFESLMNAYLLDPLSPDVLAAEQVILPAVELMRERGMVTTQAPTTAQLLHQHVSSGASGQNTEQRLEMLKLAKEQEREEKERAIWRKASEAPHQSTEAPSGNQSEVNGATTPSGKPQEGFFSKMRHGKLLG